MAWDRGFWFSGTDDVKLLRDKIDRLCPEGERGALRRMYAHIIQSFNWTPPSSLSPSAAPKPTPSAPESPRPVNPARPGAGGAQGPKEAPRRNESAVPGGARAKGKAGRMRGVQSPRPHGGAGGRVTDPPSKRRALTGPGGREGTVPDPSATFKMLIYQVMEWSTGLDV